MELVVLGHDPGMNHTDPNPSQARKRAGNYRMKKVRWQGLPISIENPAGSARRGKDKTGKAWSSIMPYDYGYIRGTMGKDGDHIDVFMGPHSRSELVTIINQVDPKTREFDEHKCMLGFFTKDEAIRAYKQAYAAGWKGMGSAATMGVDQFKKWVRSGRKMAPVRFAMEQDAIELAMRPLSIAARKSVRRKFKQGFIKNSVDSAMKNPGAHTVDSRRMTKVAAKKGAMNALGYPTRGRSNKIESLPRFVNKNGKPSVVVTRHANTKKAVTQRWAQGGLNTGASAKEHAVVSSGNYVSTTTRPNGTASHAGMKYQGKAVYPLSRLKKMISTSKAYTMNRALGAEQEITMRNFPAQQIRERTALVRGGFRKRSYTRFNDFAALHNITEFMRLGAAKSILRSVKQSGAKISRVKGEPSSLRSDGNISIERGSNRKPFHDLIHESGHRRAGHVRRNSGYDDNFHEAAENHYPGLYRQKEDRTILKGVLKKKLAKEREANHNGFRIMKKAGTTKADRREYGKAQKPNYRTYKKNAWSHAVGMERAANPGFSAGKSFRVQVRQAETRKAKMGFKMNLDKPTLKRVYDGNKRDMQQNPLNRGNGKHMLNPSFHVASSGARNPLGIDEAKRIYKKNSWVGMSALRRVTEFKSGLKEYREGQAMQFPAQVSPKLDGVFVEANKHGLKTKSGKAVTGQHRIERSLKKTFKKNPDAVLRGELYKHGKGRALGNQVSDMRQGKPLRLRLFPDNGVKTSRGSVSPIPEHTAQNQKHLDRLHNRALKHGYEGTVIRTQGGSFKRKPIHDREFPIVGSSLGKKKGIYTAKTPSGKTFKVQGSPHTVKGATGKQATITHRGFTPAGIPRGANVKVIRDYSASHFDVTNLTMNRPLIQFAEDKKKKKSGLALKLAGGAALLTGVTALPAAIPMLRIAGRRAVARNMPKTAKKMGYGNRKTPSTKESALFMGDYMKSSKNLANHPIGKAWAGASSRTVRNAAKGKSFLGRKLKGDKAGAEHFKGSHAQRFLHGDKIAQDHWDWEVGSGIKNNLKKNGVKYPNRNKKFKDWNEGRKGVQRRQQDAMSTHGKSYGNSLKSIAKSDFTPNEAKYLRRAVADKSGAAKTYARKALAAPALVVAGGAGVAAGNQQDKKKRRSHNFNASFDPATKKGERNWDRIKTVAGSAALIGGVGSSIYGMRAARNATKTAANTDRVLDKMHADVEPILKNAKETSRHAKNVARRVDKATQRATVKTYLAKKRIKASANPKNWATGKLANRAVRAVTRGRVMLFDARRPLIEFRANGEWDGTTGMNPKTRRFEDNRHPARKALPSIIGAGLAAGTGMALLSMGRPKVPFQKGLHWAAGTIFEPAKVKAGRVAAIAASRTAKATAKANQKVADAAARKTARAAEKATANKAAKATVAKVAKKKAVKAPPAKVAKKAAKKTAKKTAKKVAKKKVANNDFIKTPPKRKRPVMNGGVGGSPDAIKKPKKSKKPKQGELFTQRNRGVINFNLPNPEYDNQFAGSLSLKSTMRKAQTTRKWAGRAGGVGKDLDDMVSRRPRDPKKKRFYEKSWFKNGLATAALGGTMYGSRQMARTGYQIKAGANTRIIKKINEIHGQNLPIFSANQTVTELSSYRDSDESRDAGWDVRDARGRSARVFTPGSRPRTRREKKKSERVEHIRKVRNVAIGVATLGLGGTAYLARSSAVAPRAIRQGMRKGILRGRETVAEKLARRPKKPLTPKAPEAVIQFPRHA
jgi:hypothetical protein